MCLAHTLHWQTWALHVAAGTHRALDKYSTLGEYDFTDQGNTPVNGHAVHHDTCRLCRCPKERLNMTVQVVSMHAIWMANLLLVITARA